MWFLFAAPNKYHFMMLALEFLFVALLARSGRSKNNFLKFLIYFVDISVEFQNKETTTVVVISSSGSLIGTTFQENRQNESKITKKKFLVGELWGLFQKGLSLSTKYLDTFCEAQVITKWFSNRLEPKKYARN